MDKTEPFDGALMHVLTRYSMVIAKVESMSVTADYADDNIAQNSAAFALLN